METITIRDKTFELLLPESRILERIHEMAARMNHDLSGETPLFIAILNGSFMFAAELFREIEIPAEICFIKVKSYDGLTSSGKVVNLIGLDQDIAGRTVVILEDIIDTGRTLHELIPQVAAKSPGKILVTSLLVKRDALKFPVKVDYPGFDVPVKFLVGFGLDYEGMGRNLREIYRVIL